MGTWSEIRRETKVCRFSRLFFKPVLGNSNYWYLVDIILSVNAEDQEDVDEANHEVLHHLTSAVAESVEIGEIGAIATGGEDADDGYYLVEFTGCLYTGHVTDGSLKCKENWLYQVPGASKWFTKSTTETTIDMVNVVATSAVMDPISPSNRIPRNARKEAKKTCFKDQ